MSRHRIRRYTSCEALDDAVRARIITPYSSSTSLATLTVLATPAPSVEPSPVASSAASRVSSPRCRSPVRHQTANGVRKSHRGRDSRFSHHLQPMHTVANTSLLTREDGKDTQVSYRGFQTLAVIALIVGNARLLLHDYVRYGVFDTFQYFGVTSRDLVLTLVLTLSVPLHLFVSLGIEQVAARSSSRVKVMAKETSNARFSLSEAEFKARTKTKDPAMDLVARTNLTIFLLHLVNSTLAMLISSYAVYYELGNPFLGTLCECHATVASLKVLSFALTNRELRLSRHQPEIYRTCSYPANLTVANVAYFWWAPTLVYQPVYPRTSRIRWSFVGKRALEIVCCLALVWVLSAQYAHPILQRALVEYREALSPAQIAFALSDGLMRLGAVCMVSWLLCFFCLFQSYLNLLAELLCFSDREFYQDWWNSGSVGTYWKRWNRPVYNYFRRHVYVPLLNRGVSPHLASLMVFLISAVLHELIVGLATKQLSGIAFVGMALQVPLIWATAPLERLWGPDSKIGNTIFWFSFFVGQPSCVLLYYFAWNMR